MDGIKWIAQKIIEKKEKEWKIVTSSYEETAAINHQLAMAFEPIKEEFRRKENASRAYIAKIESTTAEV